MFGHDAQPTRNRKYHAKRPIENYDLAREQLRLKHRYRNQLCQLELERRVEVARIIRERAPDLLICDERVAAAEQEHVEAEAAIQQAKQATRSRRIDPAAKARLTVAKRVRKEAYAALKTLRLAAFARQDVKDALAATEAGWKQAVQAARKASGLYWGNYLYAEQSAASMHSGAPPEFERFEGEGGLAVQLQKGLPWSRLRGTDSRLQLDQEAYIAMGPERGRDGWWLLHFRIGSTGKRRDPLWCVIPVRLHDEPPADAVIKWVYLHRRISGREIMVDGRSVSVHAGQEEWSVMFSLARTSGWSRPDTAAEGVVAINLGYRKVPEGLRVCTVQPPLHLPAHDGRPPEVCTFLVIPQSRLGMLDQANSIEGYRDNNFNEAKASLLAFRESPLEKPEWFGEATRTLAHWKSENALAALWWRWEAARFAGDEEIFELLRAWRRRDGHLGCYARGLREGFQNWRTNEFRFWACALSRAYHTVLVCTHDLTVQARKPKVGETGSEQLQREAARRASIGELRERIRDRVSMYIPMAASMKTQTCHVCGEEERFDAAAAIWHTCSHCEARWDQDENHCANLHREHLGGERPGGDASAA